MIDAIYCLCIDKRKSMWDSLEEDIRIVLNRPMRKFIAGLGKDRTLQYNHIDLPYSKDMHRYCTYGNEKTIKHHANAFLCHKKIFKEAQLRAYNNILFVEDDARFLRERFRPIFFSYKIQSFLNSNNWDIVYLGWWLKLTPEGTEDREDLELRWKNNREFNIEPVPSPPAVAHKICGLHGILVHHRIFDHLAGAAWGPMDSYIHHNSDNFNLYYIWPKIIHTPSNFSECEQAYFNRNKL